MTFGVGVGMGGTLHSITDEVMFVPTVSFSMEHLSSIEEK